MPRSPEDRTLAVGLWLLAICIPLGITLEVLHACKVQAYLSSVMRRELWTLAHAHGNLLGILCLVMAIAAPRCCAEPAARARMLRGLRAGAVLMPLGFFLGGVLSYEGDPSYGIALVPLGALFLVLALVGAVIGFGRSGDQR
jgi:hypothetical protein